MENPREPKFLGKLDIPGFTRYLHPYNENHLIGVGIDANSRVQILMFDVSNVSNPIAISNFTVPGISSNTPVLWEHKAFLFDKAKELLVIPCLYMNTNIRGRESTYSTQQIVDLH